MEVIRKKICLEKSRNRKASSLPFIPYNRVVEDPDNPYLYDDNWGGFTADIKRPNGLIRTRDLLYRYNTILSMLRNGIFAEKITDKQECQTGKDDIRYQEVPSNENVEELIRKCKVVDATLFSMDEYGIIHQEFGEKIDSNYINLIEDYDEYLKLDKYKQIFTGIIEEGDDIFSGNWRKEGGELSIPYIEIPICLTQDYHDIGVMTPDEEDGGDATTNLSKWSNATGETNSKLSYIRSREYVTSDIEPLPGLFKTFNGSPEGQLYKFVYTGSKWEATKSSEKVRCADGEVVSPRQAVYKTVTIVASALEKLKNTAAASGDFYYFFVKFDNSEAAPMTVPYEVNKAYNVSKKDKNTYIGDFLISSAITDGSITLEYVLQGEYTEGGGYIEETGILYMEKYPFKKAQTLMTELDGVPVTIYYDKIDYDSEKRIVYSEDFNLSTKSNIATIKGYKIGDVWNKEESGDYPLFKEEYLLGASFASKTEIDIEIDRGNATAFEKHFKLGECNTFEDLENYGNNYFNIE